MPINQAFMDSHSPFELQLMHTSIDKFTYENVTTEATHNDSHGEIALAATMIYRMIVNRKKHSNSHPKTI